MIYIESPEILPVSSKTSIFLAGGITNCPDWQQDMRRQLQSMIDKNLIVNLTHTDLTIVNPRREDFPTHDPNAARVQITWEHIHLRKATAILFWFPHETLCPIVLYELGAWSMSRKRIFVGVHPVYERRQDVEIQTSLARPDVEIVYSLEELANQVIGWSDGLSPNGS